MLQLLFLAIAADVFHHTRQIIQYIDQLLIGDCFRLLFEDVIVLSD